MKAAGIVLWAYTLRICQCTLCAYVQSSTSRSNRMERGIFVWREGKRPFTEEGPGITMEALRNPPKYPQSSSLLVQYYRNASDQISISLDLNPSLA